LHVRYKGKVVGEYIVEDRIILELKAINKILPIHEAQLLNYLKATNIELGLLINFTHPKAMVKCYVSN
jgi:GxxExxY protein